MSIHLIILYAISLKLHRCPCSFEKKRPVGLMEGSCSTITYELGLTASGDLGIVLICHHGLSETPAYTSGLRVGSS